MPGDDRLLQKRMRIAFRSSDPELTKYPHCVFHNHGDPVKLIADMVNVPVGVWGDRCFVDADGEPYLEPEDGRVIEEFTFWALPENQKYARQFTSKAGCFTMVIAACTPAEVLRKTYELANAEDQIFDYEVYITRIASLIPELGWAYIPLEYGHDYAMFVASYENRHYVDQLEILLRESGVSPIFDISITESGQRWNGPILWNPGLRNGS